MAIANRQVGVTRGYKVKAKRVERREPSMIQRVAASLSSNARELREFVVDEIVYATMDTLRVVKYLGYELGFKTRARVEPVVHGLEHFVHDHELRHEVGKFAPEKLSM